MKRTPPVCFPIKLVSSSVEETFKIGKQIAAAILHDFTAGSVIALYGGLGSGKTHLTKGIAFGLGIEETITSPTYTIVSEYQHGSSPILFHIDAYRLKDDDDFEAIGGGEIINGNGVSVIEWSERIPGSLPENTISVSIEITGDFSRLIKIDGLKKL